MLHSHVWKLDGSMVSFKKLKPKIGFHKCEHSKMKWSGFTAIGSIAYRFQSSDTKENIISSQKRYYWISRG